MSYEHSLLAFGEHTLVLLDQEYLSVTGTDDRPESVDVDASEQGRGHHEATACFERERATVVVMVNDDNRKDNKTEKTPKQNAADDAKKLFRNCNVNISAGVKEWNFFDHQTFP